jgi:hypothetical protein
MEKSTQSKYENNNLRLEQSGLSSLFIIEIMSFYLKQMNINPNNVPKIVKKHLKILKYAFLLCLLSRLCNVGFNKCSAACEWKVLGIQAQN